MQGLGATSDQQIDVYRRADDVNRRGATVEVWPIENAGQETLVTIFETRPQ